MTSRSGRLRLFVIQALVFSLFATLFVRLYYLQVVSGDQYHAQATSQSLREIVVQPERGLIVDDMGRPLVANRTSWVVSIDRTMLDKMTDHQQGVLIDRVAGVLGDPAAGIRANLATCGDPGAKVGTCWNGSPYQPVPVATDVRKTVALRILEQPEDYPGIVAEQQSVRAYPRPYGINLAHVLGYLSPITESEYDQAKADGDKSVNGASSVGRTGIEQQYDRWLRGMPGYKSVAVDSMGRVLGDDDEVAGQPGDTLVTSIDAKVQGTVEQQLADTIKTARSTYDPVSHKNYVADSGAAIVMEAKTGRIVAMASQPTYDPSEWVGGISKKQLARLYSTQADNPLLGRATQGQFAPGSTWKPFMTTGALSDDLSPDTRLGCTSGLQIGNRWFKNYESESYGNISFAEALNVSCDTFFYRVGLHFWQKYGSDEQNSKAKDPLGAAAHSFGFGEKTGIDIPGEASGRVGDRVWRASYYKSMKGYYCDMDSKGTAKTPFLKLFAHEFCLEGDHFRRATPPTSRSARATPSSRRSSSRGRTPLCPTAAPSTPRGSARPWSPRTAPSSRRSRRRSSATRRSPPQSIDYVNTALLGTPKSDGAWNGTLAWKFGGFPLDQVHLRGKTGSAEVEGKQSTSWVATYDENYVVVMMVTQAGTGSGTSGPAVRAIWESLYGINGMSVEPSKAAIPGTTPPAALPTFMKDGSILPPARKEQD